MNLFFKIIILSFVFLMVLGFAFAVDVTRAEAEERTRTCCRCGDGEVHCVDENRTCGYVCGDYGGGGEWIRDDSGGGDGGNGGGTGNYGLESVPSDVPRGEIADTIVRVVQSILGFVGVILLLMIIRGGFMYMTAAGNEEQAKKAKSTLTYAIIGITIIAFAFILAELVVNTLTGTGGGQ